VTTTRDEHELSVEIAALKVSLAERDTKIRALEHKLHVWGKMLFGPRTEKHSSVEPAPLPGQPWLPFADLLDAAQRVADRHGVTGSISVEAPEAGKPRKKAARRSEFPEHLPRVRTTFEVPEADRQCCKKAMVPMGVEVTKELERIEVAIVHEVARTKYCCRTCQMQVLTAPGPTRPFPKSLLGAQWLAHLAVERFAYHMPYHRLEKKYESEGLELSRTVLSRSMLELSELLAPVHEALREEVVKSDVAFADESSAVVQESRAGPAKKAWIWVYGNKEGDSYFDYNESRGRDSPARILKDFAGYLHVDGYCVYELVVDPKVVKQVACWAHARRKFDEARDKDPVFADQALDFIKQLYAIDRAAKERELDAAELHALRNELAPKILAAFKEWLEVRATQVLPKSGLGEALQYTLNRWEALCRFLEDGRLELDNNRSERAIRCLAQGRKNWMILGNERGGRAAALFYSLITTCKAYELDPKVYLHDVMLRRAEGVDPKWLTPREWKRRFAAEVAARRDYALRMLTAKLTK
jgi:transposase